MQELPSLCLVLLGLMCWCSYSWHCDPARACWQSHASISFLTHQDINTVEVTFHPKLTCCEHGPCAAGCKGWCVQPSIVPLGLAGQTSPSVLALCGKPLEWGGLLEWGAPGQRVGRPNVHGWHSSLCKGEWQKRICLSLSALPAC